MPGVLKPCLLSLALILTEQDIDDGGRCNQLDWCGDGRGQCWTQRLVGVKIAFVTAEVVVNAEADLVWELFGGTVRGDSWPGCSAFLALSKTFTRKFHARFEGVTASYSVLSQCHQLGAKLISKKKCIIYPSAPWILSLKYCNPKHASVRKLVNLIKYPGCGMCVSWRKPL